MPQIFGQKSKYLISNDKRNFAIALISLVVMLFLVSIFAIASFNYIISRSVAFSIIFLILFFAVLKISEKHLSISNKFNQGRNGEDEICEDLQKLPDSYFIFRNLKINNKGDIDLIVTGPTGIFTIEVKSHRGIIEYSEGDLKRNGKKLEKNFLGQALGEALSLKDYLMGNGIRNVFVEPILVFSNRQVSVNFGMNKIKNVYVIKKGFLNDLILNTGNHLSSENIYSIKNILMQIV